MQINKEGTSTTSNHSSYYFRSKESRCWYILRYIYAQLGLGKNKTIKKIRTVQSKCNQDKLSICFWCKSIMKVGLKYYTSFIIQNVIIWPHSLKTFSNYSSSRATEYTKKCHGHFDWLQSKTLSIKNSYYDRKVRELLEIDMAVVKRLQRVWPKYHVVNNETCVVLSADFVI